MTNDDIIYQHRLKVFQDYDTGQYTVTSLCKKYGYSRTWFYKFRKRRNRLGDEGLRPMIRGVPKMPNQVPVDIEFKILDYAKEYPTHGPERISNGLSTERYGQVKVGHTGVYGVLRRHNLNTRKKRLEWVQKLSGVVANTSQLERDKEMSKSRHIEAFYPGELVSIDTFYVGCSFGCWSYLPDCCL